MRERGYDSYESDAVQRQAIGNDPTDTAQPVDRNQTSLGTQLLGKLGSFRERISLALVAAIPVGFFAAFVEAAIFFPAFATGFVATLIAIAGTDWLARPYRGWTSHGLVSGLTSAVLFLALLFLGLTGMLVVMKPDMHREFATAGAAIFTFFLAVPATLLWLLWGLFRRGQMEAVPHRSIWRLSLSPILIVSAILLFARLGSSL